jgi:hypothetical protein
VSQELQTLKHALLECAALAILQIAIPLRLETKTVQQLTVSVLMRRCISIGWQTTSAMMVHGESTLCVQSLSVIWVTVNQ